MNSQEVIGLSQEEPTLMSQKDLTYEALRRMRRKRMMDQDVPIEKQDNQERLKSRLFPMFEGE